MEGEGEIGITVHLSEFLREIESLSDVHSTYLNIRTGEFVLLSEEELRAAEEGEPLEEFPEWQQEAIFKAGEVLSSHDYLPLPGKFEIHEYSIMESFCFAVEDEDLRDRLLGSIRGRGAFRCFKDTIYDCGIEEDWYAYRKEAFKEIAIDWLERHNISYIDDDKEYEDSD